VIFLDEPSTGLDPQSRLTMWRVIAGLAASGVTVFLTAQYLEEADRIAVPAAGRLIAEGTGEQLKQRVAVQRLDVTCPDPGCRCGPRWPGAAASWPSRWRSRCACSAAAPPDHGGHTGPARHFGYAK
jgi:ABC-2 type transport system ATP-binding protein